MIVSTKGRYGVGLMLDLAVHQGLGPVTLKEVARRQEISEKYLWQVLAPLKAAGLISSERGARGGYRLAGPPARITVRDIVATLEGESLLVARAGPSAGGEGSGARVCREMWMDLEHRLSDLMNAVTLQDLVEKQKAREQVSVPTYSI
jgi:Rrf2 family protein